MVYCTCSAMIMKLRNRPKPWKQWKPACCHQSILPTLTKSEVIEMEANKDKNDRKENKSWFERLSNALLGEPQDREQLIDLLRDAQSREILDADAMAMIEGALLVSEQNVRDIMVPRAQMVVVQRDV